MDKMYSWCETTSWETSRKQENLLPSGHALLEMFHCSHSQQDPMAQNSTAVLKRGFVWKKWTAASEVRNRIYILWHGQML